jgi:LemA protein
MENIPVIILVATPVTAILIAYVMEYNNLYTLQQKAGEAYAGIDVQLKRRHDLIPQLVHVVEGYAKHEKTLLESIVKARSEVMQLQRSPDIFRQESQIATMLNSLLARVESYPQLKANDNFLKLQEQLTETEDQIASARRIYNDNAALFNIELHRFPNLIVARAHNFKPIPFWKDQT